MKTTILILSLVVVACCNLSAQSPTAANVATGSFQHPGLFNSREELDFIKAKVAAKQEPWFAAFTAMQKSPAGSLDYKPNGGNPIEPPVIHLSFRDKTYRANAAKPWEDSRAAYCQALLWYMTGNKKYAENAVGILNAYAGITDLSGKEKLDQHLLEGSFWCVGFVQAAEIIKHTSTVWKESDQKKFSDSLRKVWVPVMKDFSPAFNGNWDTCVTAAVMAMGVYLDDRHLFERAVNYYQKGPDTKNPAEPFWHEQARYHPDATPNGSLPFYLGLNWSPDGKQPGWTQETYRDKNLKTNSHEQGGVHGFVQSAEMAWHQGIDLYGMLDNRLCYVVEGTAGRATEWQKQDPRRIDTRYSPFYEMAYNHYHNRKGLEMPNVEAVLNLPGYRPELARHTFSPNIFGTLTCYGVGTTFKSMMQKK